MADYLSIGLSAFILFIPAFAANPAAVITGGRYPIDLGRKFIDGRRILGDGKTISGYFGGAILGGLIGLVLYGILVPARGTVLMDYTQGIVGAAVSSFSLSFGSLTGDVIGSFIKRRIGIERGGKGFLLDQWPFVLVALLLLFVFSRHFFSIVYMNFLAIPELLIVTPPLHRAVNIIGYKMKKKDVPW